MNATARGNLGSTPLCELLIFCLERKLSGSIVIETPGVGRSGLTLANGAVVKAKTPELTHRLGQLCVRLGYLDQDDVSAVVDSQGDQLLGDALRDLGLLESAQLKFAVKEQLRSQVDWLSQLGANSIYGYFNAKDFLAKWGGHNLDVDPLSLIWSASKASMPDERADQVTALLGSRSLRLHSASRVARFGFDARSRSVLDVLRARAYSYAELVDTGLLPRPDLDRVLAILVLTRHLDAGAPGVPLGVDPDVSIPPASRDPDGGQRPVVKRHRRAGEEGGRTEAPPGAADVAVEHRQEELRSMASRVGSLTYYEVLGVPPAAEPAAIQAAFFQLARHWHPDKLPPALRKDRELATKVFSRMTEAHQVLSNPAQRAEYDRLSRDGVGSQEEQERVQALLRAASAFQRAELLAKRGDWPSAEAAAMKALDEDPEQPEYGAMHAWIIAKSGQRGASGGYDDLLKTLDRAVKAVESNLRVRLWRAEVLKMAGKQSAAMRDFRHVADLQPNNVEAARELRLHQMRKQDDVAERDGILGRLFKK
ncbi:MAG: hypothetical protein RJA70_24 [Pseudomonadota bacterium]